MSEHLDTPIVIVCKDRVRYLDLELRSLTATTPSSVQIYLSNDGTNNPQMLRYLSTRDEIPLDNEWRFPEDNAEWNELIGRLPNVASVRGIAGKVDAIMHAAPAGTRNLGLAMKYAFEHTRAPYVIKMEDDLLFTADWYAELIRAIAQSDCDLVSGFRYFYGKVARHRSNAWVEEMRTGYTGGPLFIASRRYFESCPYVFDNNVTTMWDNDDLWIDECRKNGLRFGVVTHSVCQHVGYCTEAKQRDFMRRGRLLKVDRNVRRTCIGAEVGAFRTVGRLDASNALAANNRARPGV
jgi:GT2 family glycosyltransferase